MVLLVLGACSPARYDGPVSDHFDGRQFHNDDAFPHRFTDLLSYVFSREKIEWAEDAGLPERPQPLNRRGPSQLSLTWINHATVLIQADGLNLLTDPIWSDRASPVGFSGPKRHHPPGIAFEHLPPLML
ncbi:MAG: hypothetical protein ACI9G5_001754 [Paracoccaceae bacterium]|jgi:hypothetical protein